MSLFDSFGQLSYCDALQVDGAFYASHINYGKAPKFGGASITRRPRVGSLSSKDGTEQGLKKADRLELWKKYWLEYIDAFDKLASLLPESVVTVFVGRQAIEIGIKFIILNSSGKLMKGHDLGVLAGELFSECTITENYMDDIVEFCNKYSSHVEGNNPEYFRYPQYKHDAFFAGVLLDIEWLSYNIAIILLKLIHFANLDQELPK